MNELPIFNESSVHFFYIKHHFKRDIEDKQVHIDNMSKPEYLAARDINSRAERHTSQAIPVSTGNPILDANLYDLSRRFCGEHDPDIILQMLSTVMNAAASDVEQHDIDIMNKALDELYIADKMFQPYRNIRKITCFGSARTKPSEDSYQLAVEFSRLAAAQDYMIITGGGPGIMQACNEGAGRELFFGLNITLPFEQHPNHIVDGSDKMMNFYYFFTRKLNLIKQTDALVAFPGGFGTMDEIFETVTLMQTGKCTIFPVVLLDPPGETFWGRWIRFANKELLADKLISPEDMSLLYVSKSAEDALNYINRFYSRFHSYYFEGGNIIIRLNSPVTQETIDWINKDFADIIPQNDLRQLPDIAHDPEPCLSALPRLVFSFPKGDYARLKELIDIIND